MWARARSESGFTSVELLLAVLILSVGVISLIGTFDISRRVTSYSEMKEAASHVAEQTMEEMRALSYSELALTGTPVPVSSSDPNDAAYYVGSSGNDVPLESEIRRAHGPYRATRHRRRRRRSRGGGGDVERRPHRGPDPPLRHVCRCYRAECDQGPDTSATKRITVAVTVDNALGPQKPILVSTLIGNPEAANGEGSNPLESPDTFCEDENGAQVECTNSVGGTVSTWYLYDTPATFATRQEIVGSHSTHATVAATGTCSGSTTTGCPVPDLMGVEPPPAPAVTPPVYNYSSEITGGTTPGGSVIRRDTGCQGTVTTTDNTKGQSG